MFTVPGRAKCYHRPVKQTTALPPGPRRPAIQQLHNWIYRPLQTLERCAKLYGDWFTFRFPRGVTIVYTSDPEAIRDIFAGDPELLHAGEGNRFFKPLLGPRSVLVLDGTEHRRARRLMMPPFHGERMRAYGRAISELTARRAAAWPRGRELNLHHELQGLALEVIFGTVFGLGEGPSDLRDGLAKLLDTATSPLDMFMALIFLDKDGRPPFWRLQQRLGAWTPWGGIALEVERLDGLLLREFSARRKRPGDDILSLLLSARDENGDALDERELRDQMITLLVAGHETTATTLAWAVRLLLSNPDAHERLRAELAGCAGGPDELATLPYLDAVIQETLRLRPVVPIVWRLLKAPLKIAGRELPAGVAVAPCIYLTHRRPDLWPEPERFRPERFLERAPKPWEFLPFGGGGRRCLGMAFALYEMKLILAGLVKAARLSPARAEESVPVRRSVTLAPADGVPVLVG